MIEGSKVYSAHAEPVGRLLHDGVSTVTKNIADSSF